MESFTDGDTLGKYLSLSSMTFMNFQPNIIKNTDT